MTLRPCLTCGEPSSGSYCSGCRPADTRPTMRQRGYGTAWDKLSKRLRRLSPFCESCGATEQLSVDHVLPVSDYPELILVVENCRVLCRTCNAKRRMCCA